MKIEPAYVTFEQSKLLKEKGFDAQCLCRYSERKVVYNDYKLIDKLPKFETVKKWQIWKNGLLKCPEQWQVVEWLRVKYKIHIGMVVTVPYGKYFCKVINDWTKSHKGSGNFNYPDDEKQIDNHFSCFNSPQEAYSAAIDYAITKLI